MILIVTPLLVCIVGLLIFVLVKKPESADLKKIGFTMFWVGLLVTLFGVGNFRGVTLEARPARVAVAP